MTETEKDAFVARGDALLNVIGDRQNSQETRLAAVRDLAALMEIMVESGEDW